MNADKAGDMKKWTMRILGGLNILSFLTGICYIALATTRPWVHWVKPPSNIYWFIFVLFLVVNLALISLLAYLGVRLLKGDEAAILHTSAVLFAEIVSFFLSTFVFWYHFPKYVPVFDTCTDLLGPQIVTGYPVLGLVVTLVLAMRIRRNAADNVTTSLPS
jgi:hypothetical protein